MLFLVADPENPQPDTSQSGNEPSGKTQPGEAQGAMSQSETQNTAQNAAQNTTGNSSPSPHDDDQGGSIKVELDLDDAPFLNDFEEEQEEAPEEPEAEEELELPEEEPPKAGLLANKKKLVIMAGALLLIIAGAVGAFFFFFSGDTEPEPKPEDKKRIVVVTTPPGGEQAVAVQVVELKPFIVPSRGSEGEVRLLHCTLNIPYDDPVQSQEIGVRMLEIRNAIYYYLVNKPLSHLSSEEEAALLKQDLVNVINELLTMQKINDIYIQEYVVTAP